MSYFNSIRIDGDSPSADAFGRLRVSNPNNRIDLEFIYDKQPNLVDEITVGAGTVTHNTNPRDLTLSVNSTTTGDKAEIRSYPVPYTAGNSQLIDLTGVLNPTSQDGSVQIFVRTKISGSVVETTYDQDTWDDLQTGPDWSLSHIFAIDFQSLKVGRIRFGLVQNGLFIPVKEVANDNLRNSGYWQSPTLPIRWLIENAATTQSSEIAYGDDDNAIGFRFTNPGKSAAFEMTAICGTVKSEGGAVLQEIPGFQRSVSRSTSALTVGATLVPLISIRARSTFQSLPNLGLILPTGFEIATDNALFYRIFHGTTLTGGAWVNVDTNESIVEVNSGATATSGGHVIKEGIINTTRNTEIDLQNILGRVVLWDRKDNNETGILTIACQRLSNNASVYGGFDWKEIR